jgi:hypothetical protein
MTTTTMILNEKPQTLLSMSSFFIVIRLINNDQVQESIESCSEKKKNHVLFYGYIKILASVKGWQ